MFRRKRNSSRGPQNPNPSPSAQTAAAQAFLASQTPNTTLSSAAAAAALRTHTPTPTPIENVQTKRMQRRSSSTSSRGTQADNISDGPGGRGLHRTNSSGSMTTRTFREQSPGRPGSDRGSQDAPPVPPLPQNYPKEPLHRRTSSMEPPYRTTSPQLKHSGGRGGSLDRSVASPTANRYPSLRSVPEVERPGSRGSINFSYPINSQSSPRQSPVTVDRPPNKDKLVNGSAVQGTVGQESAQAGDKPVKKKKKKKAASQGAMEGTLPASDSTRGAPGNEGSAGLGTSQPREEVLPSNLQTYPETLPTNNTEVKPKKKKKKKKKVEQDSQDEQTHPNDTTNSTYSPNRAATSETESSYQGGNSTLRPPTGPKKRPSIVREDPEGEEREDESNSAHGTRTTAQPSKGPLQNISNEIGQSSAGPATQSPSGAIRKQGEADQGKQAEAEHAVDPQTGRQHSLSPTRSTRFSSRLATTSTGEPMHEPPPRSVSPAKSALKAPHPPHLLPPDSSYNWPKYSRAQSETSEGTSVTSEDGSRIGSKKRAIKVSFEDEAEVVGTAASPPTSPESSIPLSPQGKSPAPRYQWQNIDRNKACFNDGGGNGYDEVLKPRPALPSFGSVRGRREDIVEEDLSSDLLSDASSIASSMSNLATVENSASSDHALGAIIAAGPKRTEGKKPIAADQVTKVQEPLPPQVTSIEGTGYGSDSDVEVQQDGGAKPSTQYTPPPRSPTHPQNREADSNQSTPSSTEPSNNGDAKTRPNGDIPLISVLPATPALEEESAFPASPSQVDQPSDVPGSFPASEQTPAATPADVAKDQGPLDPVSSYQTILTEEGDDESDDSGESVYSDAAEDLSDLEGDGFGSINAIVESPAAQSSNISPKTPPESPTRSNFSQIKGTHSPVEKQTQHVPEQAAPELLPSVLPVVEEEPSQAPKPKAKKKKKAASKQSKASTSVYTDLTKENAPPRAPDSEGNTKVRRPASDEYGVPYASFHHANGQPPSKPNTAGPDSAKPTPIVQPKTKLTKKNTRPASSGPSLQGSAAAAVASHTPDSRPIFPQGLQRTLSNGSDSSSSFKRPKRQSKSDGRYTMRRTMRSGSGIGRPWSQDGKGSNGVRSLSPQGRRPFSSGSNSSMMRTTMRGPPNSNVAKSNDGTHVKSSPFSGFGKPAILKKAPNKSEPPPNAKFTSRFDNSSEEDLSHPKKFSSRIEDSSDEEPENEKYRPVRGIPRRKDTDDGDSTDLEDSSDNESRRAPRGSRRRQGTPAAPITGGAISTSAAIAATTADTSANRSESKHASGAENVPGNANYKLEDFLPGKKEKKPSFFHRLTLSKRDRNKDKGIHKSRLDSAARRDTSLERSRVELERMRLAKLLANEEIPGNVQTTISGGDTSEQPGIHHSSSKLRKKPGGGGTNSNISELAASGSWPLRAPPPDFYTPPEAIPEKSDEAQNDEPSTPTATDAVVERPHTADGVVNEDAKQTQPSADNTASPASPDTSWTSRFRPRLSRRQGTDSTHDNSSIATSDAGGSSPTAVGDVVVDKGGRRKKFPLLRRALGFSS